MGGRRKQSAGQPLVRGQPWGDPTGEEDPDLAGKILRVKAGRGERGGKRGGAKGRFLSQPKAEPGFQTGWERVGAITQGSSGKPPPHPQVRSQSASGTTHACSTYWVL